MSDSFDDNGQKPTRPHQDLDEVASLGYSEDVNDETAAAPENGEEEPPVIYIKMRESKVVFTDNAPAETVEDEPHPHKRTSFAELQSAIRHAHHEDEEHGDESADEPAEDLDAAEELGETPADEPVNPEEQELDEVALADRFEKGDFAELPEALEERQKEEVAENMTPALEKKLFFAALFLSGKPLEIRFLKKMFDPVNLENRLLEYAEEFNQKGTGLKVRMVSGGFQMVTDADLIEYLESHFGEKSEILTRASMETAAIIAYKQPVTKGEVDEIRGVNSSGTMKYLLDRNLIKVVGRKNVPGKPLLYATTKYFLEYFGLSDLSELPTFREWQELKQDH